jgi:hypothetical protein
MTKQHALFVFSSRGPPWSVDGLKAAFRKKCGSEPRVDHKNLADSGNASKGASP